MGYKSITSRIAEKYNVMKHLMEGLLKDSLRSHLTMNGTHRLSGYSCVIIWHALCCLAPVQCLRAFKISEKEPRRLWCPTWTLTPSWLCSSTSTVTTSSWSLTRCWPPCTRPRSTSGPTWPGERTRNVTTSLDSTCYSQWRRILQYPACLACCSWDLEAHREV